MGKKRGEKEEKTSIIEGRESGEPKIKFGKTSVEETSYKKFKYQK